MKKQEKTNVMRMLDQKKIPYESYTYDSEVAIGGEYTTMCVCTVTDTPGTDEDIDKVVANLDGEIAERILAILNNGTWRNGNTKTYSDITFHLDGSEKVGYSTGAGLFNDTINERCLFLSEEDTNFINSLIFKDNEISSSSITVLKEFCDTEVILNETQVEEFLKGFERAHYLMEWRIGAPSTNYDMCFVLDGGRRIYYSTSSNALFDKEHELYCGATNDQQEIIKAAIEILDQT